MDKQWKVEKINQKGRHRTPAGLKRYSIGDIHVCQSEEEYNYLLTYEPHHWKDACDPAPEPEKKPKPRKHKPAAKKEGEK
jgi:hypothetical protein